MAEFKVCVGVDGSPASAAALSLAIREAAAHDGVVHAVTAWTVDLISAERYGGQLTEDEQAQGKATAERQQQAAIEAAGAGGQATEGIERHIVHGLPGPALVAHAEQCQFLVVGTEHKGVLKRALVGSTSTYCLRNSRTPVIIVPDVANNWPAES